MPNEGIYEWTRRQAEAVTMKPGEPLVIRFRIEKPGSEPPAQDTDGDGKPDNIDNCPTVVNPEQIDTDGDATGDARHVDVFVDAVRMCHVIDFSRRIGLAEETLTSTDLLLTKLQIVELNRKDLLDVVALLHDQVFERGSPSAVDLAYVEEVWADDWPLWKTCQLTLAKVRREAADLMQEPGLGRVLEAVGVLDAISESGRKNLRWRLRARVGERVRWYEIPEEVD